ncbi:hypothetical protein ONZ45_g1171 [Pleurotus djamor]|nr:hypothetical protein ONZ45_g1171 [Pleurotus djamor]
MATKTSLQSEITVLPGENVVDSQELVIAFENYLAEITGKPISRGPPSLTPSPSVAQSTSSKSTQPSQGFLGPYSHLPNDPRTAPIGLALPGTGSGLTTRSRIYTTQPQTGRPSIDSIDGQTECVLLSMHDKGLIVNAPGYPQPLPRPRLPGGFIIKEVPGKGLGMIATRDFEFGELIVAERALLISSAVLFGTVPQMKPGDKPMEMKNAKALGIMVQKSSYDTEEEVLQQAFERMDEKTRRRYMALHDCHAHEGTSGPLFGRMRTNGFQITFANGAPENGAVYSSVFDNLSRLNHSCSPNAAMSWSPQTFSRQCYALRTIKKGEEITTTYMDISLSYADRKRTLLTYGINCTCKACSSPNSFLTRMNAVQDNARDVMEFAYNTSPTKSGEHILREALDLLAFANAEGQQAHVRYPIILHSIACTYLVLGQEEECKKWLQRRRTLDSLRGMKSADVGVVADVAAIRNARERGAAGALRTAIKTKGKAKPKK